MAQASSFSTSAKACPAKPSASAGSPVFTANRAKDPAPIMSINGSNSTTDERPTMSKLKPYAIEYRHEGRTFTMTLEARDHEDAKRRMASAYFNGQPFEIVASVSVPAWMAKAVGA